MIALSIIVIGLVFEAFRMLFFGEGAVSLSERLGLAHNAGYVADGENAEGNLLINYIQPHFFFENWFF